MFRAACTRDKTNEQISDLISKGGDINGTKKFDSSTKNRRNIGKSALTYLIQLYIDSFYKSRQIKDRSKQNYLNMISRVIMFGADPYKEDGHRKSAISLIDKERGKGNDKFADKLLSAINKGLAKRVLNNPSHKLPVKRVQTEQLKTNMEEVSVPSTSHDHGK
ncbi:hypothetical protein [Wolbachia endosymbiont of Ctenocephalides felis wCfeT]|uniref:hypothetical protein n=1 Tax=Wolbachia endosymbiont of Ctenocephalides felis wCfeT TaxID=2732593 RepID=UPI001444E5A4|nr:hypothetical protein [Wolbachia endosymbiont of Ctenocephalides felis wCfeT]